MDGFCITTNLERIQALDKRIVVVQGGTSAGKTVDIMAILVHYAETHARKKIWVVTDTYGSLEDGAMEDFKNICEFRGYLNLLQENKTKHIFTFPNGTRFFFRALTEMKGRGPRRDVLFVNEANRISWDQFSQLEVRTNERIFLDFNPSAEFWAHTELVNNKSRDDVDFVKLNYRGNEALNENIIRTLEQRRGDGTSNWWRVYGEGEIGSLEGNVYEGWITVEEIPKTAKLVRYGVDFGFSNDPTAVVGVWEDEEGGIWLKQELCETKLLNNQLAARLKQIMTQDGDALCICDNSRPEIIAELQTYGIRAIGCDKTPGEKMNGKRYNIELVQRRKIHYLREDKDLEREYLAYAWRKKRTGETLDEPQDGNDHIMDAIAYAIRDLERKPVEYGAVR